MDLKSILTKKKSGSFKSMIIAAHYDDETISMGSRFPFLGKIYFVHTTNSSPSNLCDAVKNGFDNEDDYYRHRRSEFKRALSTGNITNYICYETGIQDQESSYNIELLVNYVTEKIKEIKPDIIFTHPYEGGHPDHDTTSFVVNKACKKSRYSDLFEFSSYFSDNGNFMSGRFLDNLNLATEIILSEEELKQKKEMLDCFTTQQQTIRYFSIDREVFRLAPEYNYQKAPHEGKLYYENYDWGITGEKWRKLVSESS